MAAFNAVGYFIKSQREPSQELLEIKQDVNESVGSCKIVRWGESKKGEGEGGKESEGEIEGSEKKSEILGEGLRRPTFSVLSLQDVYTLLVCFFFVF